MKQFLVALLVFVFVFSVNGIFTHHNVLADNDHYDTNYKHDGDHHDDGPLKDIGDVVGWGAIIAMGSAGLLYPFRRSMKIVIKQFPNAKSFFISFSKFLGKQHVLLGVIALLFSIGHGVMMYLNKPELELREFVGIGSVIFMVIAAIFGSILIKNKKAKTSRTVHIALLVIALFLAAVHIIIA